LERQPSQADQLDVWIPDDTQDRFRTVLADLATVHEYPISEAPPGRLGRGDLLVAAHHVRSTLRTIPLIEDLRVVQTFSAGVDSLVEQVPAGITLCNATGVHDVGVAEWIMLAILSSYRGMLRYADLQRRATWGRDRISGEDLDGARVLIVGYGSIGQAVETRLQAFGANVARVARTARDGVHPLDDLPDLVPDADVVISLLPLTSATRGAIGVSVLERMKHGALLVNASRGPVVDTDALLAATSAGRIRAALDVTDPEPLPDGHPLWSTPGVLITPHVAGDVRREEERAWRLVADQVGRLSRGQPLLNVVAEGY
jgi:phosphoglycerate dehydrogenase-like enzyme